MIFQKADMREESVYVCESGAEGARWVRREGCEFAFGPVHNN